ncbi:MAG: extracellular solute-binding protein [Christensenellales bacterium]
MRSKKYLILALCAAMLLCASCAPATPPAATAAPTQGSAATQAPAPTAAPAEPAPNFNAEGFPIVNEKITLTAFQWEHENQSIDFANLWYYQLMEEKTNVHIEFEEVKDGDWETKVNLMFASGDYTDLIIQDKSLNIEEYGVTQGLLRPLDDLIDSYMPNYAERLKMNDSALSLPASDGQMYYVGFLIAQGVNHEGNWYINKNWLDKLNLEVPTTIAQLTDVLRAFRDNDPNGNGIQDEIPFQTFMKHMTSGFETHFTSFGVPANRQHVYIEENDKVVFVGDQAGFREALEWFHLCYNEGLLDKESLSMDSNLWGTKMNSDIAGYTTYLRLLNTALTEPIRDQFISILPPVADGYEAKVSQILEVPDFGAAITIANEHPEASARWFDANLETEPMMISQNGPVEPIEGNDMFKEPTMRINEEGKYDVIYVPENNGLYSIVPVTAGLFFAPADYYSQIYKMAPHREERFNDSVMYAEAGVLEYKSYQTLTRLCKPTSDEATRINELYVELDKFMLEFMSNSISGGVTDASYDQFLSTVKAIGIDEYVGLYQDIYDRFLAGQ